MREKEREEAEALRFEQKKEARVMEMTKEAMLHRAEKVHEEKAAEDRKTSPSGMERNRKL